MFIQLIPQSTDNDNDNEDDDTQFTQQFISTLIKYIESTIEIFLSLSMPEMCEIVRCKVGFSNSTPFCIINYFISAFRGRERGEERNGGEVERSRKTKTHSDGFF